MLIVEHRKSDNFRHDMKPTESVSRLARKLPKRARKLRYRCGQDYGWTMFEGSRCNGDCSGLDRADYAFPVFEYCHFDYDSTGDDVDVCGDRTVTGLAVIGE